MRATIRDEAERLYAIWQLSVAQRGRLHEFMRAITRARAAADAGDSLGDAAWVRLEPGAIAAIEEARRILKAAGARV